MERKHYIIIAVTLVVLLIMGLLILYFTMWKEKFDKVQNVDGHCKKHHGSMSNYYTKPYPHYDESYYKPLHKSTKDNQINLESTNYTTLYKG